MDKNNLHSARTACSSFLCFSLSPMFDALRLQSCSIKPEIVRRFAKTLTCAYAFLNVIAVNKLEEKKLLF